MKQEKSKARLAVERVMRTATREAPLTSAQIVERSGLARSLVMKYIGKLVDGGYAINLGAHCSSIYCRNENAPGQPEIDSSTPKKPPYTPPKWFVRDGGDAHKDRGSRRGDTVTPWQPPMLICPANVVPVGGVISYGSRS